MKISFPTNDRKTIAKRTGRCKEFATYEIEDSRVINVEYFENTHEHHDHGHGHGHGQHDHGEGHGHHDHKKGEGEHSHDEMRDLLKDVDVLIVGRVGKFMKKSLDGFGITHQRTKKLEIQEAIDEFLEEID